MGAVSKLAWHAECDAPGCGSSTLHDDEPMVYDDAAEAVEYAVNCDWVKTDDGLLVCPGHDLTETAIGWVLLRFDHPHQSASETPSGDEQAEEAGAGVDRDD